MGWNTRIINLRIRVLYMLLLMLAIWSTACTENSQPISTRTRQPLKSEFDFGNSIVVDDRFLVVPIRPESRGEDKIFSFGSVGISGSAWSGLVLGKGYPVQLINIRIIDLKDKSARTVFDRQVALGDWQQSLQREDPGHVENVRRLRFKDMLIMLARADDTNGDGQIDNWDRITLFGHNLIDGKTRRLSPEGFSVRNAEFVEARIVLLLDPAGPARTIAVYECDPMSGNGAFVVKDVALTD